VGLLNEYLFLARHAQIKNEYKSLAVGIFLNNGRRLNKERLVLCLAQISGEGLSQKSLNDF